MCTRNRIALWELEPGESSVDRDRVLARARHYLSELRNDGEKDAVGFLVDMFVTRVGDELVRPANVVFC